MPNPLIGFRRLLRNHSKRAATLVSMLGREVITPDEFRERIYQLLWEGHTEARWLGRIRAGDDSTDKPDEQDRYLAAIWMQNENEFLDRLTARIKAGDFKLGNKGFKFDQLLVRVQAYMKIYRASASDAFVDASDRDETFTWTLGRAERHCKDCPRMARNSPYTIYTLPYLPGQCRTECLYNCYCHIVRDSDRLIAFKYYKMPKIKIVA